MVQFSTQIDNRIRLPKPGHSDAVTAIDHRSMINVKYHWGILQPMTLPVDPYVWMLREVEAVKNTKIPKLVRFVIKNSLIGLLIGWSVATGLLASNINGFGALVLQSDHMLVAMFIVYFSFGLTFAFAYLTTAVLLLPTKREDFDRI